jgi:hypothetical protein
MYDLLKLNLMMGSNALLKMSVLIAVFRKINCCARDVSYRTGG